MNTVKGMTLIELLITTLFLSLLVNLAVPSFSHMIKKHQSTLIVRSLLLAINFTRSTAISYQSTTTICPLNVQKSCGKDWSKGLLVFTDPNENGQLDEQETVMKVIPYTPRDHHLYWASFGNRAYLQFSSLGHTLNQNGTFIYCPSSRENIYANAIIINRAGRARMGHDKNNNGIVERANGKDIECQ